ncbi:MAG: hypothetical protein ACPLRR_01695 [Candidatus Saccharicenans sp.]
MKRVIFWLCLSLTCLYLSGQAFETDQGQKKWPKLALKLNAGLSRINGGDLNLMINETNRLARELNGSETEATSNFKPIKTLPNLQAELFCFPLKNFALSLAVDTFYGRDRRGWLRYTEAGIKSEAEDYFIAYETELLKTSDINLRNYGFSFKIYYFVNLRKNLQVYVKGGPSVHYSRLTLSTFLEEWAIDSKFTLTDIPGEYVYQSSEIYRAQKSYSDEARKWYTGFQGGFGLQLNFSPRQALVLEADLRLARARSLRGTGHHLISHKNQNDLEWESSVSTVQGELRYAPITYIKEKPLNLMAIADPSFPAPGKTASLNMNGIVVKAGFRFKL